MRSFTNRSVVRPDTKKHPLGQLVEVFRLSDLKPPMDHAASFDATITNCEYVASYSWTDEEPPTILVPGK